MNRIIRIMLTPLAILFLIIGIFLKPHFLYLLIFAIILIFDLLFYSGRKQRIKYWFQEYKKYLSEYGGNKKQAISKLLDDFQKSKYGSDLDVAEYYYIEALIEEIIIREYKFEQYLHSNGELKYRNLIEKLRKEIASVKKEVINSEK